MVIADWALCPQTRIFNYKTRKGEKIAFTIGFNIKLNETQSIQVSKEINIKISSGTCLFLLAQILTVQKADMTK
jgi:hypothetical protein